MGRPKEKGKEPSPPPSRLVSRPKGRTIRKVIGGGGDFQLARIFFFAHCFCRNIFFQVNTSARNFFFRQILLFFLTVKSRFIIYVFVLYKFYRIFRKVPNSNIYLLQILFYYFYYNTVYIVCAAENLLSDIKFRERESALLNTTTKRKTKYCGLS